MVYETDAFYRACDELGLMVWQDFMFANMDYPVDDAGFGQSVHDEADQQLRRLSTHPCVVALLWGSEVEQQAAMFGAPREVWSKSVLRRDPARVGRRALARGTLLAIDPRRVGPCPFTSGRVWRTITASARTSGRWMTSAWQASGSRRSASASPMYPGAANLDKLTRRGRVPPHHPAWKLGVPRDSGPGWDFEDIRDHYLERLYDVDAVELRSVDLERYLELSRSVTGEVMAATFAEWRHPDNACGGALTWFLNDLRPGAGWGLIDSDGEPKAALHHLRRAWSPCCVRLLDRGLDGLVALLVNDTADPLVGRVELLVLGPGGTVLAEVQEEVRVEARVAHDIGVESLFGHFLDSTYSYRFGPPRHEAVAARLLDGEANLVSEDLYLPNRSMLDDAGGRDLEGYLTVGPDGGLTASLCSDRLLYDVRIEARDHRSVDNHFWLVPGRARTVRLERVAESSRTLRAHVEAANLSQPLRLVEGA